MQQNLRQQMNPHFVFNTLNSIQYFLFQNDKKSSNFYLSKFAQLLRTVIDNSNQQFVLLKEELSAIEIYLELEKLRFKDKISYTIELDGNIELDKTSIPPMFIQPFIENAILHGLIPLEKNGAISIQLKKEDNSIVCFIVDSGIGRKKSFELKNNSNRNHKSLGTKISENRIKLLNAIYKKNLKIEYTDLYDEHGNACGTQVKVILPSQILN